MRKLIAAAIAATMSIAANSSFAFDASSGRNWQPSRPIAAVAYFKMPLSPTKSIDRASYGLALTAPSPRTYGSTPLLIGNTPKLLDLRFHGFAPETLRLSNQVAWNRDSTGLPEGQQLHLFGGGGNFVLGVLAGTLVAYGIYAYVHENCPAISTTTGKCVRERR